MYRHCRNIQNGATGMIRNSRKKILRLIPFLMVLLWSFSAVPLSAATDEIAVVPFKVTGFPDRSRFSEPELPVLLQEATHFLLGSRYQQHLQSLEETGSVLASIRFRADQALDSSRASALCSALQTGTLLLGSAHFSPDSSLRLQMVNYSCTTRSVLRRDETYGSVDQMQKDLRHLIVSVLPSLRPLKSGRGSARIDQTSPVDIALLLDGSGSMNGNRAMILEGLKRLKSRIPPGSRIGGYLLKGDGENRVLPMSSRWNETLDLISRTPFLGEVDGERLSEVTGEIGLARNWNGKKYLLILSDASLEKASLARMENRLRWLKRKGFQTRFFQLPSMNLDAVENLKKLETITGQKDSEIVSGIRLGYLDGSSNWLIQKGNHFYLADEGVQTSVEKNRLPESGSPLATLRMERSQLRLETLPEVMSRMGPRKVIRQGPLVSGLPETMAALVSTGSVDPQDTGRVLVYQDGVSFWISVADRKLLKRLEGKKGQHVFIGLHWNNRSDLAERIENLPEEVLLVEAAGVPRLFVNTREHLLRVSPRWLDPEDLWFFNVEVRDVKYAGEFRDIRE